MMVAVTKNIILFNKIAYGIFNAYYEIYKVYNMATKKNMTNNRPMQQKELINILMDSDLYLDLPLEERHLLLKFILDSYSFPSITESNKDPFRII